MLLKTAKKRRLTALLALPACALVGLRKHILPAPAPPTPPNRAIARAAGLPETLPEALAAARREGFAITAQDLQAPLPPPEQNAAPLYTELARQPGPSGRPPWDALDLPSSGRPTEAQIVVMRKAVADNFNSLEMIHQAAARPHCVFLRDWAQPSGITYPEYAHMRFAAQWLTAESLLLLHDGKPLEAVRTQALGFAIARHAAQEPTPISYFVACAIQNITLRGMQNILLIPGMDTSVANAVRQAVEQNRVGFSLTYSLHGQLAVSLMLLESARQAYPQALAECLRHPVPPVAGQTYPAPMNASELAVWTDRSKLLTIKEGRLLVALSERPYVEARTASKTAYRINAISSDGPVTFMGYSEYRFLLALEDVAWLLAQEEAVRAACALLVCKAAQGAFPDRLEAALAPAPADPFGTGALGYRKEGAGFVLYSVGKTGKYNGKGEPDPSNRETCLRYPLNAHAPN